MATQRQGPWLRTRDMRFLAPILLLCLCLAGCAAPRTGTPDDDSSSEEPYVRVTYGDHPDQYLDLYRPDGAQDRALTVLLIHGGFWKQEYRADLMEPLARDLAGRGYTVANLEYRRVGGSGGWPETFEDVAAGMDALADQDVPDDVVTVGHSAGGHLAVWAASRVNLADGAVGANPVVVACAAVAQAGVVDLTWAAQRTPGGGPTAELMGGLPDEVPDRYAVADPSMLVPASGPVLLVHAPADSLVSIKQSLRYAERAEDAGAPVEFVEVAGDHFTVIDPRSDDWLPVVDFLSAACSG